MFRIHLGNVLHALGRLDEAEACFREAIRLRPDLAAGHANLAGVLEQRGDFEQAEDSLREALRHDTRHAGALTHLATQLRERLPTPNEPRSSACSSSPPSRRNAAGVFGAGELRLAQQAFEALPAVTGRSATLRECLDHLGRDAPRQLASRFLDDLSALNRSADRIVDKMPENYLYLGLIATLFPRAKLIHCRRDVRDVVLSCWLNSFGQVRWACDPNQIASRIADYRRVMDHWRQTLPVPVFEVDYEAIVADPEPVFRALVAWSGLEWNPACLEFHKTRRPVQTASVAQVRRLIYRNSVGRWKNYEHEPSLAPWFARLAPNLMARPGKP